MKEMVEFLARHGYLTLFGAVLARQACLPVPTNLILVAAGAMARTGRLSLAAAIGVSVTAFMLADLGWYEAGRRFGDRILHFMCGLARDPGSCIDKAAGNFSRRGVKTLLFSKFVLGLDAVAAPLAGRSRVNPIRFLAFDGIGALSWSAAYMALGYIFSDQLELVAVHLFRIGTAVTVAATLGTGYYVGRTFLRWLRFLHEFRLARITPDELRDKLNSRKDILILDLQGPGRNSVTIPGAIRIDPRRLEQYKDVKIPPAAEAVLYCACPGEYASARVALALRRRGIQNVRPLAGGLKAWRDRGFPVASAVIPPAGRAVPA